MKKLILCLLFILCLPVHSQPLSLSDWQRPHINTSISNQDFTSVLDCESKTPYYVFYNLYPNEFLGLAKRINKWPNYVPQDIQSVCGGNYAITSNYSKSGYDRGHLAPAADFNSSQSGENMTFTFANAAPQNQVLNRGKWEKLEEFERQSAIKHNGITVITGVIQGGNRYIYNNVAVPNYYYKIILWKDGMNINKLAFFASNTDSLPEPVGIKYLEKLSGMDFGL